MQKNPQERATEEKESFLSDESEHLMAPVDDMSEVIKVLQFVTGTLHKAVLWPVAVTQGR